MLCRSDPSVSFSCANCDEYVVHWMVKVQLTIVHAFIISRLNYGNAILPNAPRTWTDKLRRFLNAAARVISGTRKFDRDLTHILHDDLHWLDVPQRVIFKLCMTVCTVWHCTTSPSCVFQLRMSPRPVRAPKTTLY